MDGYQPQLSLAMAACLIQRQLLTQGFSILRSASSQAPINLF